MPELPEVETVRSTLDAALSGRRIAGITIHQPSVIKKPGSEEFAAQIVGQSILTVRRRGKYLLIELNSGDRLVVHLRMTGQLVYSAADAPMLKHTHLFFQLDNGHQLRYTDQRRFGCLWLVRAEDCSTIAGLAALGPEPLGESFTREKLAALLHKKKTKIKAFLLDQHMIAGIGNIYADEILFAAGIHPQRLAGSLSDGETSRLHGAIQEVLSLAVAQRGTSFSDYVDGRGEKGSHQDYLKVYHLTGQSCQRCGISLCQVKVAGRSSHFCPGCQK